MVTPTGTVTVCIYGISGKTQEIPLTLEVKDKDVAEDDGKNKKKDKKGKKDEEEKLFGAGQKDVFMVNLEHYF